MNEWKECKLGDVPLEIIDGDRGNNYPKKADFSNEGYCLFLNTKNVTKNCFSFDELNFISQDKDELLRKGKLSRGDLILTTRGTVGNIAFYDESIPYDNIRINSGMVIVRAKGIDKKFNYYLFKSLKAQFDNFATGSAQPQLPIRDLRQIEIKLPPLPEQKTIAAVLSSLDDKIDLLHRQNKTLEAMAETLFRQWFVEEVGEDWEELSLYDVIELIGGGTPNTSTEEYWGGNIKWISAKDITANHKQFIINTEKKITELGLQKSSAKLISKYSTIISARGTVGKYCLLSNEMAFSQSNYGIKPKLKNCCFFTYLLIAHSVEELQSAAYGSVFDTITTKTFKEHKVNIPLEKEIIRFEERIKSFFFKMEANSIQIKTLSKLRDTLLPKLMSGEVRVKI
ncbi:type I restriction/modification specificity protein [Candidatus Thiomargarita nelsonii]|uniref:Type I restriction/modification specificity protein n=1 Tax=Candidatus Thiomargarita nelsonii TaxID=1003181 RepID=A0A176RTQ7_9GAMM|nr:type I restriction/modification specificity protein [Candidatus Thiomargarita nelsonii]